jgi:hypothetical protein
MVTIDLINENAIEIGATYKASFRLCNHPDLLLFTGVCQIRVNNTSTTAILTPIVNIITKDTFSIDLDFDVYPDNLAAGNYQYDVLFSSSGERFYAVGGKIQIVKRITAI